MCWHSFPLIAYRKGSKHDWGIIPTTHIYTHRTIQLVMVVVEWSLKTWRDCIKWATYPSTKLIRIAERIHLNIQASVDSSLDEHYRNLHRIFDWFLILFFSAMRAFIFEMNIHGMSTWKVLSFFVGKFMRNCNSILFLGNRIQFKKNAQCFILFASNHFFFISLTLSFVLLNESTQFQELSLSVLR